MRLPTTTALLATLILASRLPAAAPLPDGLYAEFTTPHGTIVAELLYQQAPLAVTNFVGLTEGTLGPGHPVPYYTGLKWYRVVPGFVIQSGNPAAPKDGDTGYTFPDEFAPGLHLGEPGILAMANAGPATNSGEFFLTLADCTRLNYLYTVFGRTVRGLDVLPQIKPDESFSIRIERVGAAAQAFKADRAAFAALRAKTTGYAGETAPGPAAHFDDPDHVLPVDVPRAQYFNYKLNNFQHTTGRRIFARVYRTFTPAEAGQKPATFTRRLAQSLGLDQGGVLAVYFADQDRWFLWVGNDLMPEFTAEADSMSQAKAALLAAVKAKAADYTKEARQVRGTARPLTPADLAKYSVDAMVDMLVLRFEPQPAS